MLNLVVITLQNAIESIERAVEHGIMNFLISSDSTMLLKLSLQGNCHGLCWPIA